MDLGNIIVKEEVHLGFQTLTFGSSESLELPPVKQEASDRQDLLHEVLPVFSTKKEQDDGVDSRHEELNHKSVKEEADQKYNFTTMVLSHSQAVRISVEQRTVMLDYMIKNPALATGRFNGPEGAKYKQTLLKELAATLNSLPNGVSKSAEKWMKSWQDWRSDVKSKASNLKKEMKTGGGKCLAKPLTPLEEQLLSFLGLCLVSGHEEVLDPLAIATQDPPVQGERDEAIYREPSEYIVDTEYHDEFVFIPLEEHTISAPDLSPHVASPPLVVSEGSVPPSSALNSGFPCSSSKKRKHHVGDDCTDDNDLLELYKQQLACMQEQNNIRRAQLQLDERKTIAIESAAVALTGAMKALKDFLKHGGNSED